MQRVRMRCAGTSAALATALTIGGLAGSSRADVQIGDWEQSTDGWIDWGTGSAIAPPKYTYSTSGVTSGAYALQVNQTGWNQNLAIKLQNNGLVDDFLAHTKLRIDLTVPQTTESGWAKIEEITLNAQGASWGDYKLTAPILFGWPAGGGAAQSTSLVFDYSAYLSDPDVLALGHDPWWVEIIITTNSDASHGVFQFDNARLTDPVPEPAALGVGGAIMMGLLCRPRRRA